MSGVVGRCRRGYDGVGGGVCRSRRGDDGVERGVCWSGLSGYMWPSGGYSPHPAATL